MAVETNTDLDRFETTGFVILKGFYPDGVVEAARRDAGELVDRFANRLMAAGKITSGHADAPFETRLARICADAPDEAPSIFRKELHLAGMYEVFFHPPLLDIVETLLGEELRLYPNYSIRPKLPDHAPTLVLWHQDGGYTYKVHRDGDHSAETVDALRMINVWSPLVPAREDNGCMQFIPGTHRIGMARHEDREHYLEITQEDLAPYVDQAVSIEMDPGDIVLFHNMLYHQGLPNRSDQVRWSMDWRYQDARQPTLRSTTGHLARSRLHLDKVVRDAGDWVRRSFQ
ncbi:MAG: phytanoyl-CoA dioxygenase family protein [Gemmatimonadota bacterium]|nr:phytanoyl-CoA dioxygenase family protein [Gemmatimonadota bacterium]